jgi:hypothetical protein
MSEIEEESMDLLFAEPDIGGLEATYFAPNSTIGVNCHVLDEPVSTVSDIGGGRQVVQRARIVSARFPRGSGVTPMRDGRLVIGTDSYRVVTPDTEDRGVTWLLDMEPL